MWILATKVISHNKEGKVPLYVYYLYKGLSNNNVNMQEQLLKRSQNEGKKIEEIIKELDDESYCNVFASGLNVIGSYDCTNGNSFIKDLNGSVGGNKEINCTREYKLNIDIFANVVETMNPEKDLSLPKCEENKNSFCLYKPEINIKELFFDNTKNYQAYECDNIITANEDNENDENKDVSNENKTLYFKKPIKLTNNINLGILYLDETIFIYNFKVNITQPYFRPFLGYYNRFEDCEKVNPEKPYICETNFRNFLPNGGAIASADGLSYHYLYFFNTDTNKYVTWNNLPEARGLAYIEVGNGNAMLGSAKAMANRHVFYLEYDGQNALRDAENCKTLNCDTPYYKRKITNNGINIDFIEKYLFEFEEFGHNVWYVRDTSFPQNSVYFPVYSLSKNFDKLCTMFDNNSACNVVNVFDMNKYKIDNQTFDEGSIEKTQTAGRLIYAAIDTTFEKGEMDKNIFIFEHFEDKIIPVGYLANNENTPLKFDVITRDPVTFKIKKVNNKPLTYCEAMEYTGEKFSKYCNCKDKNEKVITQYEEIKDSSCKNAFGCIIKLVKPSLSKKY